MTYAIAIIDLNPSKKRVKKIAKELILVVDDEPGIRELIQLYLENQDYRVLTAKDGEQAIDFVRNSKIDLILLDIEMPDLNGFEVCKRIRTFSKTPIIFVSSKRELTDRIEGIQTGADDYIMKPFDFHELGARVESLLRRIKWLNADSTESTTLLFNDIMIDLNRYKLMVSGQDIPLSNKEFQLLVLMAKEPNRIWSAEQLYDQIWGFYSDGSPQTVKVHISNLRKKLEPNPAKPIYIQTVRGFGYKFNF